MLSIGDVQLYVSDFDRALRFWSEGLGLFTAEKEMSQYTAFARLDFPDGGPSVYLFGPVDPWEDEGRPEFGSRPGVGFDVTTSEFDATLVRLLDCGGKQSGEIESYNNLRSVTLEDPDGITFELIEVPIETS